MQFQRPRVRALTAGIIATVSALMGATSALKAENQETQLEAEPSEWESFESGDIIFQQPNDGLGEFLARATGTPYGHIGILRETGGGWYVMDTQPEIGITELRLEEFLERGIDEKYAVYRLRGVKVGVGEWPPAILTAYEYINAPYDPFYRRENTAFYPSEFVYQAYKDAGVELGTFQPLSRLGLETKSAKAFFLDTWKSHPECKTRSLGEAACKALIEDQPFITPLSIAKDPKLKLIYSSLGMPGTQILPPRSVQNR